MPPEVQLLVIAVAFLGFWLIVLRPARNAQRRTMEVQQGLAVGDKVLLSAGIFGTVASLDDEKVGLELAPGTVVTVARQAVVRIIDDRPVAADQPDAEPDNTEE